MTRPTLAARALMGLVQAYRLLLSPWLGQGCRFEPTCSRYALTALAQHGAAAGSYLTLARIVRCHPGCAGGHDPVPEQSPWRWPRAASFTGAPRHPADPAPDSSTPTLS